MKSSKFEYNRAKAINIFHCLIRKIKGHRNYKRDYYYGKKIKHDFQEANNAIYDGLMSDKPFLVARFGDAELRALVYSLECNMGMRKKFPEYIKVAMHRNAGFFPADDVNLQKFGDLLWESSKSVDIFGVWYNLLEDYIINKTSPNSILVDLEGLEPYRVSEPWSRALKGKKVLVIHPFSESIEKQYSIREKIFSYCVLPDFELITYKAIQTNAGGTCEFATWFEALDKMYSDISCLDFDIAIVGCGAYGLPLSAKIKTLGKKVIHLAGATQIMFGIRGARWDSRPEMQHLFNEFWIRPSNSEKPKDASSVEGGCYW